MSVLGDRRLGWLVVALCLVTVAFAGAAGVGTFAALSALVSLAVGESALVAAVEAVLPYVVALVALGVAGVGLLAWTVLRAVRLAELPRSDRLASVAERAERHVPGLGDFGVSDALTPTPEDRREALKQRYARGELTEAEFEREMARLLDDEGDSEFDGFDDLDARLDAIRESVDEASTRDGDETVEGAVADDETSRSRADGR